ncbi:hypothetical protein [Candidatus Poriferisodalis sp.]|uniref:hypothetical protein n=1 Tax=Candidatus Poriferisodalis sp. TaxID=3101277 RepID=UPI003B027CB9
MTAGDELCDATADFISANDIEHVQIVGGAGAVSADVASALTTLGVDTVDRVEGDSAAAVSVALAGLANDGCGDDLGLVSGDRVALVRGNPDGVVAAPVLASSLSNGYLVPPLVVGDSLPGVVRDYLAATPQDIAGARLNLGIVAVGGTAAVTAATMDAAVAAASSADALSVRIGAATNTNNDAVTNADDPVRPDTATEISASDGSEAGPVFTLYFSDSVEPDVPRLQDIIEINGVPAVVLAAATSSTGGACDKSRIDVTLGQHLRAGDVISVVASDAKFGTGTDQRTVAPASATVQAKAADRTRPAISIVGIAGTSVDNADQEFHVSFSDDSGAIAGTAVLTGAEVRVVAGSGGAAVPSPSVSHTAGEATATVDLGRALVPGDRLIISPGAVSDADGNVSAGTSGSAFRAQASPVVRTVLMSDLKHSAHAGWTVPAAVVGGAATDHAISINAKGSGDAAGAAGNGWTMVFDRASTFSAAKPLDIDVRVDTRGQRVTVRFNSGPATATLGDLLAALKANAEFDARFSAGFANCQTGRATTPLGLLAARNASVAADGAGRTQFAIEAGFNAFVSEVRNTNLLTDVLAATAVRTRASASETLEAGFTRLNVDAAGGSGTAAGGALTIVDDLSAESPSLSETVTASTPPTQSVRYEFETALVRFVPRARDLVETAAGNDAQSAITGPPAFAAIIADAGVATGYAADAPAPGTTDVVDTAQDRVDEDLNGASQRRITMSSSVKTP